MLDLCALHKHGAHAVSLYAKLNSMPCTQVAFEDLGLKHSAWSHMQRGIWVRDGFALLAHFLSAPVKTSPLLRRNSDNMLFCAVAIHLRISKRKCSSESKRYRRRRGDMPARAVAGKEW